VRAGERTSEFVFVLQRGEWASSRKRQVVVMVVVMAVVMAVVVTLTRSYREEIRPDGHNRPPWFAPQWVRVGFLALRLSYCLANDLLCQTTFEQKLWAKLRPASLLGPS